MHCCTASDYVKSRNDPKLVCHNVVMIDTYSVVGRDMIALRLNTFKRDCALVFGCVYCPVGSCKKHSDDSVT